MLAALYASAAAFAIDYFQASPVIVTSYAIMKYSAQFVLIAILIALLIQTVKLLFAKHPQPALQLLHISRNWFIEDNNGIHVICTYLLFVGVLLVFGTVKSTLPQMVPFDFDVYFYQLDRQIFGVDPYLLLLPVFGGDSSLFILNNAYQVWLIIVVLSILWVAFSRNHPRRLTYLFASILSFSVSGNLLAVSLSSAGPCFLEPLFGLDYYSRLFDHLNEVNDRTGTVWALAGQRILWNSYAHSEGFISGISAMPSMHNVFAWLWVFAAWPQRTLRYILLVYAVLIFIGSIVLGWHYAVDGIAGFFLAVLAWVAARSLARISMQGAELRTGAYASNACENPTNR